MRLFIIAIAACTIIASSRLDASAFWGNNERQSPSGLDVVSGYDVNTVTTINGTVISSPARIAQSENTGMTIQTQNGPVTILLGPWTYWERQVFSINPEQKVSITGSRAQGKDGSLYLFAQKLDNITTGTSLALRSETGTPLWTRSGSGTGNSQRSGRASGSGYGYRGGMGGGMGGGGRR